MNVEPIRASRLVLEGKCINVHGVHWGTLL